MAYNADADSFIPWFARKMTPSKPPRSPQVSPAAKPAAPPAVDGGAAAAAASSLKPDAPVFTPKTSVSPSQGRSSTGSKYNTEAAAFVPKAEKPMDRLELSPVAAKSMTTKTVASTTVASNSAWSKGAPVQPLVPAPKPAAKADKKGAKTPPVKPQNGHKTKATPPATPPMAPQKLPKHSDAEALVISQKSSMSAAAHVFLPRGMVTAPMPPPLEVEDLSPPPRPVLESAHPAGGLVLDNTWVLYYNDFSPSQTIQFDPCLVYNIDTIETFWRTVNNLPTVTNLPIGSTFFLFKDGIDPKWEDEANKEGGSWSIRFHTQREKPDTIDEVWQLLCARLVGESWDDKFNGTVNGLVAKVRDRYITLQVWVTEKQTDFPHDMLRTVESIFPAFAADYVAHNEMHALAQQREKEAATTKKKRKH
jgi:hypothetical protein